MWERIRRFFLGRRTQVRAKLTVAYILTGIIPLLLVGFFLVINTRHLEYQHRMTQLEEENKRVMIIAFNALYLTQKTADSIFFDEKVRRLISHEYKTIDEAILACREYSHLRDLLADYTMLSGISIYVNNPTMPTTDKYIAVDDAIRETDWYKRAAVSNGEAFWHVNTAFLEEGYLTLVRKIPVPHSSYFGVLLIRVSHNYFRLLINDGMLQTVMTLDNGAVVFSPKYEDIEGTVELLPSDPYSVMPVSGRIMYGDSSCPAVQRRLEINRPSLQHFKIITFDHDADEVVNSMTFILSLIVFLSISVPFVFINLFSRTFSKRVVFLRRRMHMVAEGDFSIMENYDGSDELTELYNDMKIMVNRIEQLYGEIYSERLAKERLQSRQQEMRFKMLASQINPHFLFNTLEVIRMKAFSNGDTDVARIIKQLGKLMRRMLDIQNNPVTLASELEHIRSYFDILEFRFFDRVQYSIRVDDTVRPETYFILPLLIQPLVENAVIHGLEAVKTNGKLDIHVKRCKEALVICVADNGVGISEERLETVRAQIEKDEPEGHIGLYNVSGRIKLAYGVSYGITVDSTENEGTRVTLILPPEGSEEINHAETVNSGR